MNGQSCGTLDGPLGISDFASNALFFIEHDRSRISDAAVGEKSENNRITNGGRNARCLSLCAQTLRRASIFYLLQVNLLRLKRNFAPKRDDKSLRGLRTIKSVDRLSNSNKTSQKSIGISIKTAPDSNIKTVDASEKRQYRWRHGGIAVRARRRVASASVLSHPSFVFTCTRSALSPRSVRMRMIEASKQ